MAAPLKVIFGNIWASDGTTGYGPTYDGGRAIQNAFITQPSPFEGLIRQRQREMEEAARAARKVDPLDEVLDGYARRGVSIEEIEDMIIRRSVGEAFEKSAPKPDPPMPKLVELRPKRQIQIED